jgi:phage N-6-adenine-methyltransferase
MKGTNTGKSGRDDWRTPDYIYDWLNRVYGPFEVDAAADAENAKCDIYYDKKTNGLAVPWPAGKVFCNPPWSQSRHWAWKATDELLKNNCNCTYVLLLPASTDTAWFHMLAEMGYVMLLNPRIKFDLPNGAPNPKRPDRGAMVVVLGNAYPIKIEAANWRAEIKIAYEKYEDYDPEIQCWRDK